MSSLFESNWAEAKKALCEGADLSHNFDGSKNTTKAKTMEIVLENARKDIASRAAIFESATAGGTSSANVATLNKVILPIIRRVMPTVIANEIVGVQPMTGPVAQIHTLRLRYGSNAAGVVPGQEALSPFAIAAAYAGNENVALPGGAPTSALEGRGGNTMNLQVLKATVEANTRRLQARWTIESAQDAQAQQGIDIEAELMAALAQEITNEIDQEILRSLRRLPGTPTAIYDQSQVSGTATYVGEEHAALAVMINRQANLVAKRTRRGAANWAVISTTALSVLQSATTSAFARTTQGVFDAPTNTKFVGTLNNSMRVYVDQYADDGAPVLIGYKGTGETDAAAYFCPYVPLTSSGVVIDPQTFEPVVSLMSRYGFLTFNDSASSFGNSADYLSLIGINADTLRFS